MNKILPIIESIASEKCQVVLRDKSIKGGHNGPYYDPETEIRVSSHWIFIFEYEFRQTGNLDYIKAIEILANNLVALQLENGTFLCRNKNGKDKINGTIGISWAIEGLIEATKILKDEQYYNAAVKAFNSQKFDYNAGLWIRQEVDGSILGVDNTFNHQLWFAASGAQICSYKNNTQIEKEVLSFLDHCSTSFRLYKGGLIHHFAIVNGSIKARGKSEIIYWKQVLLRACRKPSCKYKEEGYHNFSIYAFALIHMRYPEHLFFNTLKFRQALSYSLDMEHSFALQNNDPEYDATGLASEFKSECNIYGFSYNSPAFEIPFIVKEFGNASFTNEINKLLDLQIDLTFDANLNSFCRNTEDPTTLDARLYEYIRALL
ncbi:MAG: hypothetical protein LUH23_05735 [Oscillospiraceae bacterium]|nr:hypothetical protein [Oscillospiraceae bacterium]